MQTLLFGIAGIAATIAAVGVPMRFPNNPEVGEVLLWISLFLFSACLYYYKKHEHVFQIFVLPEEGRIDIADIIAQGRSIPEDKTNDWKNKAAVVVDKYFSPKSEEYKLFHEEKRNVTIDNKLQRYSANSNLKNLVNSNNVTKVLFLPQLLANPNFLISIPNKAIVFEFMVLEWILEKNEENKAKIIDG